MGTSGQTHRNNELYEDKDSSAGIPELVERPDDSDDNNTVENSVNGTESTLDTKCMTALDKEYSDGKVSIKTIKSSVINIGNMEMIAKTRQVH